MPGGLGRLTYGELIPALRRDDRRAGPLGGARARVAIVSPNAAKLLIALYAMTGSGRVLVPINFRLSPDEAQYIVDDAGAVAAARRPRAGRALRRRARAAPHRPRRRAGRRAVRARRRRRCEWPAMAEDAPATLNYTSGTTAAPKGVVLTHRSHWLNATSVGWGFGLGEGDRLPAHAADLPRQRLGPAAGHRGARRAPSDPA